MSHRIALQDLTDRLRDHIIGALHVGHIHSGDRLPSVREVAEQTGQDPRKVARAYRLLEAEGLVEVRERSGVYAAPQARLGGGMLEATAEWLVDVLLEAWTRRISVLDFPGLVRRCTREVPVRCAFVDSCEDAVTAFSHELREEFGFRVTPVGLHTLRGGAAAGMPEKQLPEALAGADIVITTIFNATSVRALAQRLRKTVIVVSVHPHAAAAVARHLQQGRLTVVCVDPTFGDRIRLQYGEHITDERQLRIVLADDREAVASLAAAEPVILTRAARARLGELDVKLVIPHSPTLSPHSAREIVNVLVRMNSVAASAG